MEAVLVYKDVQKDKTISRGESGMRCAEAEGTKSQQGKQQINNNLEGIMKWIIHSAEEINCNVKFKCTDFCFTV